MNTYTLPYKVWILLLGLGILEILLNMEYTAVNLAFVPIAKEIDADLGTLQWLLSGYILVWGAFLIPAGRLSDLYGTRNMLIGGLLLFIGGSYIAGAGTTISILILGRLLQGLGGALFTAPIMTTIYKNLPENKKGLGMGIMVSCGSIGTTIGPTIAGLLIDGIGWRWIFYMNVPFGLLILLILMFSLKKEPILSEKKFNFIVASCLSIGLCITIWSLGQLNTWGITDLRFVVGFLIGFIFILAYIFYEIRSPFQVIPFYLLKNRAYQAVTLGNCLMAMGFSMVIFMMRIYLQNVLNYESHLIGLIFLSLTIPIVILSPISGKIINKIGVLIPMVFGCIITIISFGIMASLWDTASLLNVITAFSLAGFGAGSFGTACYLSMMRSLNEKDLNIGTSVYAMTGMLGSTFSVILSSSFFVFFGKNHLFQKCANMKILLNSQQQEELMHVIAKAGPVTNLQTFLPEQASQMSFLVKESCLYGFSAITMFGILFPLMTIGIVLLLLPRISPSALFTRGM